MTKISALIVDDERLSRQRIRRMLSADGDVDVVGECSNGRDAVEFLKTSAPDLMFLDVQMPECDGFAVLEASAHSVPATIFVTAYDEYALRAFDVHAVDYLLKPFDDARLAEAVRRAKDHLGKRNASAERDRLRLLLEELQKTQRRRKRIAVRAGENVLLLRVDQIDWIEAADNYANLHVGPDKYLVRETMNSLEHSLDPAAFIRVHRSAIVNIDRIKALQPWFRGDYRIVLNTGEHITLSRSYRQNLQSKLLNA